MYLLQDSGWYGVNEKYIEELQAGKNMGCGWYSGCKDNNNHEYFCDQPGESLCNFDYSAYGICKNEFLEKDDCHTVKPYTDFNCAVLSDSVTTELIS